MCKLENIFLLIYFTHSISKNEVSLCHANVTKTIFVLTLLANRMPYQNH